MVLFEYSLSNFCQKILLLGPRVCNDMRHPVPSYSVHAFLISGMSRRWTVIVILCHMYNSSFGYFPKLFDDFWIDTYYLWIDHYGMFLVSFSVQFTNEVQWLISNWKYVLQNTYLSMYIYAELKVFFSFSCFFFNSNISSILLSTLYAKCIQGNDS